MVEPIEVRLIRITEEGLVPSRPADLPQAQGGVAFLNDLRDRPISIFVPKGAVEGIVCSYTGGFDSDGSAAFTKEPIPPGGAVSLCLHEAGTIRFEIHGAAPEPLVGQVEVIAKGKGSCGG